jgi:DNA-binding CsgD family transcriptional regulator
MRGIWKGYIYSSFLLLPSYEYNFIRMAKTLFFIEALAFALVSIVFPSIATEASRAFILPVVISLVLPLAGATAIWPPRAVLEALRAAFSANKPDAGTGDSVRILDSLVGFSRAAAVLGFLFAIVAVGNRPPLAGRTWTLLGAFLCAYALLNAELWRILAKAVAERGSAERKSELIAEAARREAAFAEGKDFASRYALTPREWDTASLIAEGKSYKEAAYELGISIKTVKVHMSRVYEKTGSASNVGLLLLLRPKKRE